MAKLIFALLAMCVAAATARMAYVFPAGVEFIFRERSFRNSFTCDNLPYGYYADVDNHCEIFHVCQPIHDGEGHLIETAHFSFACGNQTIFSQESLTCAHPEDAFPCDQAQSLYQLSNADFGRIPDEFEQDSVSVSGNGEHIQFRGR